MGQGLLGRLASLGGGSSWLTPTSLFPQEPDPFADNDRFFGFTPPPPPQQQPDPFADNDRFFGFTPPEPPRQQPPPPPLNTGTASPKDVNLPYEPPLPPNALFNRDELAAMEREQAKLHGYLGPPRRGPAPPPAAPDVLPPTLGALVNFADRATPYTPAELTKRGVRYGLQGVHGAYVGIPAAIGEHVGGDLPGHEGEGTTVAERAGAHFKQAYEGGGGEIIAPGVAAQALLGNKPDNIAQRPTRERVYNAVERKALDMAFYVATDPLSFLGGALKGVGGEALSYWIAGEGAAHVATVFADKDTTPEEKAEAIVTGFASTAPVAARLGIEPIKAGATAAGKTAATAAGTAAYPVAAAARSAILAMKLSKQLPNIRRAAPEAFGAGTRAPLTVMEHIGGSELPAAYGGEPMTMGEILRGPFEEKASTGPRNEAKPPPVTVPETVAPDVVVETPRGIGRVAEVGTTETTGIPMVSVQLADGTYSTFRPEVVRPVAPPEPAGILTLPKTADVPPLTPPPAPAPTQPALGLGVEAPPTTRFVPKGEGEAPAVALEKARTLQQAQQAATGLPHVVIETPQGFIVSGERGVETPSQYPDAQPDENVTAYQQRTRAPIDVALKRVEAARVEAPPVQPSPRVVAPPLAPSGDAEQQDLFGAEPAAPSTVTPRVLSDDVRGRYELTLPQDKGTIDLIDPARAAQHAEARGADKQVVDDWHALPASFLYVDTAQVKTPRQGDGTKLYQAAMDFATSRGYVGLASKPSSRTPAADALWTALARRGNVQRIGDYEVVLPTARIEAQGQGAASERERDADYRGPGSDPSAAEGAVPASGVEDSARAVAPNSQNQAIANAIVAHAKLGGRTVTVAPTPDGVEFHAPDSTAAPVRGRIVPVGTFGSPFDNDNALASYMAEVNASGTTHYRIGGGTRWTRHPLPKTVAEFNALPKGHQEKLRSRYVVVGRHTPSGGIEVSEDWAHDPDVWLEEHFHAGVERMTPEEKKAARVETKAQEEARYREGYRVPDYVYSRGILGSEGQAHGRQKEEARADAGASRRERSDGAVQTAEGPRADARGEGRSGEGVYSVRARAAGDSSDELTDDRIREAVGTDFARLLASILDPDGGFTYSPISGSPTTGFALSVTKAAESVYAPPSITPRTLADYIRQHKNALSNPRNYIGAWHNPDDGKAYLDISTVVKTRDEAERLGLEHDQLAYYDLVQGRSIKREDWDAVRRAGPELQRLDAPSYAARISSAGVRDIIAEEMDALYKQAATPGGGVTWSPVSSSPPGEGYVIGTKPATAQAFTPSKFTPKAFADFVRANADALRSPKNYIRVWNNKSGKKRIYLDIAQVVTTPAEAQRLGVKHGRTHYLNLKTGEVNRTWLGEEQFEAEKTRKATVYEGNQLPRDERAPHEYRDGHLYLSARMPKGPSAVKHDDVLYARLSVLDDKTVVTPEAKQKYVDYAWEESGLLTRQDREDVAGDGDAILDRVVDRTVENLRWLWDRMATAPKFTEEIRERARQWYRGAHRIATRIAKQEGFTRQQVAGVFAALSPQMDWFKNVDLGRRVIALYKKLSVEDAVFTTELMDKFQSEARAKSVTSMKSAAANARKKKKPFDGDEYLYDKGIQYDRERARYEGKSWSQMDDYGRALLLRTFDEHSKTRAYDGDTELEGRAYQIIAPEGTIGSYMLTTGGASAKTGWGNYDAITNAIAILRDKSHANIDLQLGDEHKVRSFFNNIENPESADFVTVDTHAVAANHLLPLSGEDPFVKATLGGSPSTTPAGLSGVNIIEAEAYFRLAQQLSEELGRPVLPREVQSVTWEAIRLLYKPDQKRDEVGEKLRADANALQARYQDGTLSREDYHAAIEQLAGGFELPAWATTRDETTADEGGVPKAATARGRSDVPARRGDRVGGAEGAGGRAARQSGRDVSEGVPDVAPSYAVRELERDERGVFQGEDGPQAFYHGSTARDVTAETLDPTRDAVRTRSGPQGISFTTDPRSASNYTRVLGSKAPRGRVVTAHLAMQNPLDITDAIKKGRKRGLSFGDAKREALKALTDAHDGVVFRGDPYNADEYVVFKPSQVVSVTSSADPASYGVRTDTLTLDRLQREATTKGVSLADAVKQARADGRDIDVSDYFNFRRVDLPDDELQALENQIIDTAVATGQVPKARMKEEDIRAEAQELGGTDLAKQLEPYLQQQLPMRAVRDAARHRINELSREIFYDTKALAAMPVEQKAEREAAEEAIAEKQTTIQQLLNLWMRIRSEDGRNLAMHRMMSDSIGWQWGDKTYWFSRAKRELGLPQGAELPPDVVEKLNDILERGREASGTDADEDVEDIAAADAAPDALPDVTAAPQGTAAGAPAGQAGGAGTASTSQPDASGGDVTGESGGASRGRMTSRPRVEGPVLPPLPPRGGSLTRGPQVEGPVLPPLPSRGPMTRGPAVEGPVLPPVESRGRMTSRPPVEGPVLPPKEGQQGGPRTSKPRGPAPWNLTPPPGDPKPPKLKMHGPPLSYPERKRDRKPSPKEAAVQMELADYLVGLKRTPWLEALSLLRKAGLLTGIPTHVRNIVGNIAFQAQEETARGGAALADMLIKLGTGKRTVEGTNLMAMLRAMDYARTEGWQQAKQTMSGGALTAAEKLKLGAHRELNTGKRAVDAYGNFVFRSLTASDRIFKAYAFMRSLDAQAAVLAHNSQTGESKQTIRENPTPAMVKRAKDYADFATFNNKNVVASMWQRAIEEGKRGGAKGKFVAYTLDTIVPFTNTPANIFERVLEGTPPGAVAGMGVAAYRGWKNRTGAGGGEPPPDDKKTWRQKKPTQRALDKKAAAAALAKELTPSQQEAFALAFGRGLPGLALMSLGAWLAAKGLATGTSDSDEGMRNVKEAAGQQPGSIKFGTEWRRIDQFAPVGTMIVLGASLYEHGFTVTNIGTASAKLMSEQPMLQGTQEALRGIERWDTAGQRWVSNTIGSFVPSVVSNVGADTDPYRREGKPEGDVLTRGTQMRTPGWRRNLPARTDIFGRSMTEAAARSLDPTTPMRDRNDSVTRALLKYGIGIGKPDKVPESVETDAQYRLRVVATGRAIRLALEDVVGDPAYQKSSDEDRIEALEAAIAKGRKAVPRPTPRKR